MSDSKFPGFAIGLRDTIEDAEARKAAKIADREDPAYLDRVRKLPCCMCGKKTGCDPHHWPKRRKNGGGDWHDHKTIPLCRWCHTVGRYSFHQMVGSLRVWENYHKVSIADLIHKTQKTLGIAA